MLNAVLIISILETGWNVGIFHQLNMILDSYYLNPFNWMLFFGIGLLMYRDPQKAIQSFKGWWGFYAYVAVQYTLASIFT